MTCSMPHIKKRGRDTYHGTIVTLNPTSAQTLKLVIVLTAISTSAVNVRPMRECTEFIRLIDKTTYATKVMYAR
jgi:hypothetical protein